jgi:beta-mannosidase
VPRDAGTGWDTGAGWDFDDVRDYYLGLLHGLDPVQLRRSDHERYLELSRAVSGEVMAEVMGEWRRAESPCRGALVLWLKDMLPGAGLGVLDHSGEPKVAYHHLRRALAPIAVWSTDEGVNGVAVHVANDRPEPLHARLRVALYRDLEARMDEAHEDLELPPHGSTTRTVEGLLGRFVDAAWAYRFGPPAQDAIVLSLETAGGPREPLSQSVRFTAGRPRRRESAAQLGLEATAGALSGGVVSLAISCRRLAYGVRVQAPGFAVLDDAFTVEPGVGRTVQLRATDGASELAGATLTALNLDGSMKVTASQP